MNSTVCIDYEIEGVACVMQVLGTTFPSQELQAMQPQTSTEFPQHMLAAEPGALHQHQGSFGSFHSTIASSVFLSAQDDGSSDGMWDALEGKV